MFSKNKNKGTHTSTIADRVSIVAAGMQIHGDIEAEGDIRIDGKVHGNIFCKSKVVVISSGAVDGDVTALDLLSLKAKSTITGNLITEKLQIKPNATFNGQCTMSFQPKPTGVNEIGVLVQEN